MTAAAVHRALSELRVDAAACQRLWVAVVERVLLDADRDNLDGERARLWLRAPDDAVLTFAGLNPETARPALVRSAASARTCTPTARTTP